MNKRNIYSVVAVLAVALLAGWLSYNRPKTIAPESKNENIENKMGPQTLEATKNSSNKWVGILNASDNKTKGQYFLKTEKTSIYIKTQRNYDSLVGKKVEVLYSGTAESFILGDILLFTQE
jgi:hypothetical protein